EPTVMTPSGGTYQFTGLTTGAYQVVIVPPTGRLTTLPLGGVRGATVIEGQATTGINFGTILPVPPTGNHDPVINNTPPATATVGIQWRHEILATDPDPGDILSYEAPVATDGLAVDPVTGVVAWTPAPDQIGTFDLILLVRDNHGGVTWKAYQVTVGAANT